VKIEYYQQQTTAYKYSTERVIYTGDHDLS